MKKVLITATGAVATDITIKSLKRMGFSIVGCNMYPKEWVVESCEVDVFYKIPPVSDDSNWLNTIKEICIKENINFLLPMIDYEIDLLNKNREWFEKHNVVLCISPETTIDLIRNKKHFQDFVALECPNIKSIPTKFVKEIEKLDWKYPVVCKPYNGRSSQGLMYIHNDQEWQEFISTADINKYIVEPFIKGPLVMVEVVRQNNPVKSVAMSRREILSTPNGCALTVYVFKDEQLEERTKDLANKLNIIGDVNFEYILDENGEYHLVECNPRFSAGCEFACIGGYDCIENHMKCFMNKNIEEYHFKHTMVIARKYEEVLTAVDIDVDYVDTIH